MRCVWRSSGWLSRRVVASRMCMGLIDCASSKPFFSERGAAFDIDF